MDAIGYGTMVYTHDVRQCMVHGRLQEKFNARCHLNSEQPVSSPPARCFISAYFLAQPSPRLHQVHRVMASSDESQLLAQIRKNKTLESELSKAVKRATAAKQESDQLAKELSSVSSSRDKLLALSKGLKSELSSALERQAALEAKSRADAEKVAATIEAVQTQVKQSIESSETLATAVQEENSQLRDRLRTLADAASAADRASKQQLELKDAQIVQLTERAQALQGALSQHESVTSQAMDAAKAALDREAAAKAEVTALKGQIGESTEVIQSVRQQLKDMVALRKEVAQAKEASLRKEKALLETALLLQTTRADMAKVVKQRDALQSLCQALRAGQQAPATATLAEGAEEAGGDAEGAAIGAAAAATDAQ